MQCSQLTSVPALLPGCERCMLIVQTLARRMRFGKDFDWVRGGKLPGLCGSDCLTGCKAVTGLDGWSSRQMWRPCVWPPEYIDNQINCTGGKMVAYVYHMFKEHWCGDDFEFQNDMWERTYKTNKDPKVTESFFQPNPKEWYTIWSHVRMNDAGAHPPTLTSACGLLRDVCTKSSVCQ
jgi:hypothetical protein